MDSLTILSLFSGCGGLDLGSRLAGGYRTIAYCEILPYCQGELMSLMRSGTLDYAPIYDDIKTFDARGARGLVDVVAGGDPCQPHSLAGKRKGLQDERWLWPHFKRIIEECRPRFVLRENTPGVVSTGGLITPLEDLEEMGYRAAPYQISAAEVGAWHLRKRIFIIAHLNEERRRVEQESEQKCQDSPNNKHYGKTQSFPDDPILRWNSWRPECEARSGQREDRNVNKIDANFNKNRLQNRQQETLGKTRNKKPERFCCGKTHADPYEAWQLQQKGREQDIRRRLGDGSWWDLEPGVCRVVHGCPYRVDRIGSLGNIVVPQQSVPAWEKIKNLAH